MKARSRLVLFVVLPLIAAVGAVTWAIWRQLPAPGQARRPLPATTQVASGRAALAWSPPLSGAYAAVGFLEPDSWYAAMLQPTVRGRDGSEQPGNRPTYDLAAGDASGGLLRSATNLRAAFTGPGTEAGGVFYAPTGASDVTAIDLTTQRALWTADVGAPAARIAVAGNRVAVTTDKRVACFDSISGKTLWTANVPGITTAPALAGPFTCFATGDALHVIDAATGRELRKVPVAGLAGRVVIDGDRAYAFAASAPPARSTDLYAIDLARGSIAWKWQTPRPSGPLFPASEPVAPRGPVIGGGLVIIACHDRLYAIDASTGRQRWLWESPSGHDETWHSIHPSLHVGTPAVHDGVVYAVWGATRVSGWDLSTGREAWRYEGLADAIKLPYDCPPAVGNGMLLCVIGGRSLCALRCDLIPKQPFASVTPVGRPVNLSWALGVASSVLLVGIILGVFGLWRLMIAAICLVLCGLTVFAWVRSYAASEFVGQQVVARVAPFENQVRRGVTSRSGGLTFGTSSEVWSTSVRLASSGRGGSDLAWARQPIPSDAAAARQGLVRFAWTRQSRPSGTSLGPQAQTGLTIPHWTVAAVLAVAPLAWLSGVWRDRRRYPRGHCRDCGYDLRGISGRCPECGLPIPPARVRRGRRV